MSKNPQWKIKSGAKMCVEDMTDDHIQNCINQLMKRRDYAFRFESLIDMQGNNPVEIREKAAEWIERFEAEQRRRRSATESRDE